MNNEQRKYFYMNRNIKLSPVLIALTWDILFWWSISTLYLTMVKGLTNSQVVILDSILMGSGALFCIPLAKLFQNVKPINTTRIGLLAYIAFILFYIFGNNFWIFILAQPFLGFGYVSIAIKINSILTNSLREVKRDKDYQRIYGKGMYIYYILEMMGAIITSYLFYWNPNLCLYVSLAVVIITFALTYLYKEPSKFMESNINLQAKEQQEIKSENKKPDSFWKIMKSAFFISLLIYMMLVRGILSCTGSALKIYLNELVYNNTIPVWSYGYFYAGTRLVAALFSKYQFKFNLKFGVRTLLLITSMIIIGFVATGVTYLINPTAIPSIIIILLFSYILCAVRTPNQIFINNYIQVCTPKRNHERAYSIRTMAEYIGYATINSVYALLLSVFHDNYGMTQLVYIGIFAIPLIVSVVVFIRLLVKKHTQKYTVIKDEYTKD